ncbi:MAG: nucleotide sugar dehydrogenase [Actinobacteria bacterium 13_1_40CM_2_65_8]|nr:MAG: nucleotide sugar dehydrogenase [Chloroflexi bacterium 13_1_40CM_65_17]OLD50359.1 MAG: nucleotide sugar dehydrogenase [Actinobacteria bacterium 13_1_40CM_2_65_8]
MDPLDVVVVGGCGHVGLPLALSLAECGYRVGIDDIDAAKVEQVRSGSVPFLENGAEELLRKLLPTGRLELAANPSLLERTNTVILVIGTPIDEFMNPSVQVFDRVLDELIPHLHDGCLVVLRSTVFPGTTQAVERRIRAAGIDADVAFCPERIAEGHALEEIRSLPQLIGVSSDAAFEKARGLFAPMEVKVVRTTPLEAELAKLLTNTWRYMKFAIANQFFQIAHRSGVDYDRVLNAVRQDYPRAADLPGPGFAAGPCLLKDTMQLSAFTPDRFPMGQAAMQINEGLPNYIVDSLDTRRPLAGRTLGILGMAFKGESDDPRASLSYKLRKLAAFKGARVLCTDPFIHDESFVPLDRALAESDVLVIAAPHRTYKKLDLKGREVVDVWGITGPIRL